MTRRERLLHIFGGLIPDRPAVKVWNASPFKPPRFPVFEPVRQLAIEKSDLAPHVWPDFEISCGANQSRYVEKYERPADSDEYVQAVTVYHTPEGDLEEVFIRNIHGKPGHTKERLLKEPDDLKKVLALPYDPIPFSLNNYLEAERELGDAGVGIYQLENALARLVVWIGSENFALWSLEHDDLISEALEIYTKRICDHVKEAARHDVPVFGWWGPEYCIPPLMSPAAFERYVFQFEKGIADIIHNAGRYVWVHCHGKMKGFLERFADMGVDVLNPIEPPPMGDVTMEEAFAAVGNRMGLEGNIETHDFMTCSQEDLEAKIHATLDAGAGKRLILCPSSGYDENSEPSDREIDNWLFYINESVRYAEAVAGNGS